MTEIKEIKETKEIESYCDHFSGLDFFYSQIYEKALELPEDFPFLEVGTRAGGTSLLFLKAIGDSGKKNRFLITVDPYGAMLYPGQGDSFGEKYRRRAMKAISDYCFYNELNHFHFRLTSFQFYQVWKISDFWDRERKMNKKFGVIFLDGDHSDAVCKKEIQFFQNFIVENGLLVIDDKDKENYYTDVLKEKPIVNNNRLFYKL
ncbi:MAG: class I SAM-dependent methyltransferase [Candidatus Nealsonbacteria bacterium]|nr:class I SAM-dependent methyltransferase [Candidatus Nealsonbacteria bacterium]